MKKATVSWVFVGPEPYLATCQRCGKHEPKPELPTPFDAALKYMEYISEKHRYCKETRV